MKLDSTQAQQLMAIHYLPGLRLAVEELTSIIRQFEGVHSLQPVQPVQPVDEKHVPKPKRLKKSHPHPYYSDQEKAALAKESYQTTLREVSERSGVSLSALNRWRKEFGSGKKEKTA